MIWAHPGVSLFPSLDLPGPMPDPGNPQGDLHRETSTGKPPQGHLHRETSTGRPPQGDLHTEISTGRDKAVKSVAKTDVCCTWRHSSVAKGHFHVKTTKTHWENEGPAQEARIFTRRYMFWALLFQINRFLLRNERAFYAHFYDGYRTCINHRKHVWLLFISSSTGVIFHKIQIKHEGFSTLKNNDKTGMF